MIYSAADIEAYLTGKLSAAEMHAMEKAALHDPFLAEAMEGFEAMQGKPWNKELEEARKYIMADRSPAKIFPLQPQRIKWWKAAAAVFVIGCGAAITFFLTREKPAGPGQIAQNIPAIQSQDSIRSIPATSVRGKTDSADFVAVNETVDKKTALKPTDQYTIVPDVPVAKRDSSFLYTPLTRNAGDIAKNEPAGKTDNDEKIRNSSIGSGNTNAAVTTNSANGSEIMNTNAADVRQNNTNILAEESMRKKSAPVATQANKALLPPIRNFIAQVVGPDNTPLPFANININKENFGTYADVKGNFRLVSTDSLVTVEVKSVGYLPKIYTLRSNLAQNRIVLSEDEIAYKEKTEVKGKKNANMVSGNLSRRATLLKDSVVNVEPKDGWDNYSTYIANNIDIPDDILKKEEHGELQISFDVKTNGTISNVKIGESNCDNCAESAKRLIEQGPQWKLKKGKKASAKIKVQF